MLKKRFSVELMIGVQKQQEIGVPAAERDPEGRDQRADFLPLEGEVRWP